MSYAVSPVLLLGSLAGQAESCIQQGLEFQIRFLPRCSRRSSSKAIKLFVVLTQVDFHPKFSG